MLGFRSVKAQDGTIRVSRSWDGNILSLSGTGMFWLKHWVGQATSASCSTAQAVFELEHLREGGTKGSSTGTDNFVPNKTEREKRERAVSLKGPLRQEKLVRGQNG